jgi:hypothetical protein
VRVQLAPVGGLAGHHDLQGRVAVQPRVLLVPAGRDAGGAAGEGGRGFDWKKQEAPGQGKVGMCICGGCSGGGRPGSQESRQAQRQATSADVALTWLCTRTGAWRWAGPPPPPAACSQSRSPAGGQGRAGKKRKGSRKVSSLLLRGASSGPAAHRCSKGPCPCAPSASPTLADARTLADWPTHPPAQWSRRAPRSRRRPGRPG